MRTKTFVSGLLLASLAFVASCGSTSDSLQPGDPSTSEPSQTYINTGPYSVGVTTLTLERGPKVEVWLSLIHI